MKELEKMKELWKEVHENENNYEQLYKEQIMKNLTLKSNGIFVRLSTSVKYEYMALAASLPVMLMPLAYISDLNFRWSSIAFAIVMALYGLFFWNDFRKIQNYSLSSANLNEQLSNSIEHLEKFVKKYFTASIAMWPMVGALYYFIIFRFLQNAISPNEFNPIGLAVSITVATFIGYFVQKWYTQKMYGKYVDELKNLQKELQTEG